MIALPLAPSRDSWVQAALAGLPTLLVDHAHCERKAAQTALKLMAQHADWPALVAPLSRLAREELVHFERVQRELGARGLRFGQLPSASYGSALLALRRPAGPPPGTGPRSWQGPRTVDDMLVCAIIEARSHERFVRLAAATDDARLRVLYQALLEAEERHGQLYLELAAVVAGGDVGARLGELCRAEDDIIHRPGQPVRMHAGG
jgi:tRNA-(ms[2]io[6]A)-hydroxylase